MDCHDEYLDNAGPPAGSEPELTERMYRVKQTIEEDGRVIYAVGALISLQEAILRDLPGAREMAVNASPLPQRKELRSPENRDAIPEGNR